MKPKIIFIERKPSSSVSIERVFRQVAKDLPQEQYDIEFQAAPYGNGVFSILKNLLWFRRNDGDIYHLTGDVHYLALVLPRAKTILTIHDLVFLRRRTGIRRAIIKKLFLDLPIWWARHVTTVSEATKREIVENSGMEPESIKVIENPLIDGFRSNSQKIFDTLHPTVLHIGTAENKNLPRLIAAMEGLPCKLRIIGRLDSSIIEQLSYSEIDFENVSDLDQEQIVAEYGNADIVSFCSTYEGFGLPIIEAQAMSKPVITSNLSPMKEVAGYGALVIDPFDAASIRSAIVNAISDPDLRTRLIAFGLENTKRFEGKRIAEQYAGIYENIVSEATGL